MRCHKIQATGSWSTSKSFQQDGARNATSEVYLVFEFSLWLPHHITAVLFIQSFPVHFVCHQVTNYHMVSNLSEGLQIAVILWRLLILPLENFMLMLLCFSNKIRPYMCIHPNSHVLLLLLL